MEARTVGDGTSGSAPSNSRPSGSACSIDPGASRSIRETQAVEVLQKVTVKSRLGANKIWVLINGTPLDPSGCGSLGKHGLNKTLSSVWGRNKE